ncbi:MAG: 6-phosphogluconolactonase, partial [Candidatus Omnitrophica bacterium]|nr:6-phosphogluconolactonase [Candidatus Omnitrophota bacterium]
KDGDGLKKLMANQEFISQLNQLKKDKRNRLAEPIEDRDHYQPLSKKVGSDQAQKVIADYLKQRADLHLAYAKKELEGWLNQNPFVSPQQAAKKIRDLYIVYSLGIRDGRNNLEILSKIALERLGIIELPLSYQDFKFIETFAVKFSFQASAFNRSIDIVPADEFSEATARVVANKIWDLQKDPDKQVAMVFATGGTMVGFLNNLAKAKGIDWSRVQAFHLDEYKGLATDHPASFAYFLNKNLFSRVPLPKENIHYVNGAKPDFKAYLGKLKSFGGADIVLLGVGMDGHLAFNEPPAYSSFDSRMQEVKLVPSTIEANKADYPEIVDNPYAYTMGMADIFEGKHLFFFANKQKKAAIVKKSLEGPITESVPASMLQKHHQVTIVLDEEAASLLKPSLSISNIYQRGPPGEKAFAPKNLLIIGGMADLMSRFYKKNLDKLIKQYNIKLHALDVFPEEEAWKRIKERKLPYSSYTTTLPETKPDAVLVLTYPDTHLEFAQWAAKHRIPVFVEKLVVLPNQLQELEALATNPDNFVCCLDYSFDNPAVLEAAQFIANNGLGKITEVKAALTSAGQIVAGRTWHFKKPINGGGSGMDLAVHLIAAIDTALEGKNLSFKDFYLDKDNLFMARYHNAPPGEDTYTSLKGVFKDKDRSIPVNLRVGEGVGQWNRNITIKGTKGDLFIDLGSPRDKGPSVEFKGVDGTSWQRQHQDMGYYATLTKIFETIQGLDTVSQKERDFRLKATMQGVAVMDKAYQAFDSTYPIYPFGQDPGKVFGDEKNSPAASKIRAILWDIDGVLLKKGATREISWSVIANELSRRGVKGVEASDLYEIIFENKQRADDVFRGDVSEEEFLAQINRNLAPYGLKEPFTSLKEYYRLQFATRKSNEDLVGFLSAVKQVGIIQGIITDRAIGDESVIVTDKLKSRFSHIFDNFSLIFNSSKVRLTKSDPAFFELAFQGLQKEIPDIKPEEVLFVDDNPENCRVAENVGFQAVQYNEESPQIENYPLLANLLVYRHGWRGLEVGRNLVLPAVY